MSNLPAWIGIPGSVLFIAVIVYGFRQGMTATTRRGGGSAYNGVADGWGSFHGSYHADGGHCGSVDSGGGDCGGGGGDGGGGGH
jgi:hypothetical protein